MPGEKKTLRWTCTKGHETVVPYSDAAHARAVIDYDSHSWACPLCGAQVDRVETVENFDA